MANDQAIQEGSGDFGEIGSQRISVVSNQANGKEKSDSFVVDIEGFTHFVEKDLSPNSRIAVRISRLYINHMINIFIRIHLDCFTEV